MTREEAIKFAKHVERRPDVWEELEALQLLARLAPQSLKEKAIKAALDSAEALRREGAAGHRVHYPIHVRTAAVAIRLWGEPACNN